MAIKKQSTWRQVTVESDPQTITEFVFPDTKPNHVMVHNLGGGVVYMGVSLIPSNSLYDSVIPAYSESLYAQETGFTRLQLFNDGTDTQRVKITSFEHDFDPTTIKPTMMQTTEGGTVSSGDGTTIINGFSVPLPSGSNNIGRVVVSEMPAINVVIDTLPVGTNVIGRVHVDSLPPLSEGISHIGSVGIDGGVTIESMPPVTVSNQPVKQSHQVYEAMIGHGSTTFDMQDNTVNHIVYIINEGVTDLFITFDMELAFAVVSSGYNKSIRLKPGEAINDMPRRCNKVNFSRSTGTGLVRFLGV